MYLFLRLCRLIKHLIRFYFNCGNMTYAAVSSGVSLVLSSILAVILFSTMQIYRPWLASAQLNTILGGYIGSWLFIFTLTVSAMIEPSVNRWTPNIYIFPFTGNFEFGISRAGAGIPSEAFPRNLLHFSRLLVCVWNDSSCVRDHLVCTAYSNPKTSIRCLFTLFFYSFSAYYSRYSPCISWTKFRRKHKIWLPQSMCIQRRRRESERIAAARTNRWTKFPI